MFLELFLHFDKFVTTITNFHFVMSFQFSFCHVILFSIVTITVLLQINFSFLQFHLFLFTLF